MRNKWQWYLNKVATNKTVTLWLIAQVVVFIVPYMIYEFWLGYYHIWYAKNGVPPIVNTLGTWRSGVMYFVGQISVLFLLLTAFVNVFKE